MFMDENFRRDLVENYKRQYNLLVYGIEDYCHMTFDINNATNELHKRLVGQSEAISALDSLMENHKKRKYSSAIIYGTVGVGKSYSARLLADHFQWRENVHLFKWDASRSNERNLNTFLNFLFTIRQNLNVKCGHNLILIDNLTPAETTFVTKMNEKLKLASSNDNLRIITIFIASVVNYKGNTREGKIDGFVKSLSNEIMPIEFRDLTQDDLIECIKHEAKSLGINLNEQEFDDVIRGIDVRKSGCKAVQAKVKIYGSF
jgi:Cdc6-like AAA superfamily ATPase